MADVDAALEQQIPSVPPRQREGDINHHQEANYLRRELKDLS
jgi:hypothetical protein